MKACNDCGHTKAASDYYTSQREPDGRAPVCKACAKRRARVTNRALAQLRDRHYDEYLAIRVQLMSERTVTPASESVG